MKKSKTYDTFIFRESWWNQIKMFPDCRREEIYDALCKYVFEGIEPEYDPMNAVHTAIHFIVDDIKANKDKYDEVCAKRSEAARIRNEKYWSEHRAANEVAKVASATNATETPANEVAKVAKVANGHDNDNEYEYDYEKDIENENEKDKSFSFSQKKEKIIFDFSLILLSEGRPNASKEAREAYEYNESTNWTTETTKPNGDVQKKKITNPLSWLRGWKRHNEQIFAPADGMLFADIIRKIAEKKVQTDNGEGLRVFENVINHFRGFRNEGDDIAMLFINCKTLLNFRKYVESDGESKQILFSELQKQFPKAQTLYYKTI